MLKSLPRVPSFCCSDLSSWSSLSWPDVLTYHIICLCSLVTSRPRPAPAAKGWGGGPGPGGGGGGARGRLVTRLRARAS